jgi:Fur family transcriptional regulator, peroxide stress response regulator
MGYMMNMSGTTRHRLTPHRQAVLETIVAIQGHPTAAEVFDAVQRRRPRIAFGTVYTALHYLVDRGLLAEVRRPDGVVSYDRETSPHDHAVCRQCGRLVDVQGHLPVSYAAIEQRTGYTIEQHQVQFIGLCPDCRAGLDRGERSRVS